MNALDDIIATARSDARHIIMAEGADPRIVAGSARAVREGLAKISLVGDRAEIERELTAQNVYPALVTIVDPREAEDTRELAGAYHALRKHKGVDEAAAAEAVHQPLCFAAMMVRLGKAEGTIGGAVATTADTVRMAMQVIGRAPGCELISSFFLMMLCEDHHPKKGALVFADCGLIVEPDARQLRRDRPCCRPLLHRTGANPAKGGDVVLFDPRQRSP